MMYGESIKERLDRYISYITYGHCVQTEVFLMRRFGFDTVKLQYDRFTVEMKKNIGIEPTLLNIRFKLYSENKTKF